MDVLLDFRTWIALFSVTLVQIALGADNLIIITIIANKLPGPQRKKAIYWGLILAMAFRIVLLSIISLVLRYATGTPDTASSQAMTISRVDPQPAPVIDLDKAIELLDTTGSSFVFFIDEDTNEPSVAYHRYDGHYGLLTARTPG